MRIKSIEELWLSPPEDVNCVIEPGLLPTGGIMVVIGEPGIGKSFLVQQMAFEIATGRRLIGIFPCKRKKVAYFELEKRSPISRRRFKDEEWQKEYPGATYSLGFYDDTIPRLDTDKGAKLFKDAVEDFGCKVVIVDSFSVTLEDEIELSSQKRTILKYREIAKDLKLSFILIQHLVKRGIVYDPKTSQYKEPPLRLDDMRGSKYMEYEVDTVMGLVHGKSKGIRQLGFLKHSFSPIQLSEEQPLLVTFTGSKAVPFNPLDTNMPRILSVIDKEGPLKFAELESRAGISRPTFLRAKDTLISLGLVEEINIGRDKMLNSLFS